jgi:2-hydroxyacyl-CoA lyase 1
MSSRQELSGAQVVAETLHHLDVSVVFGIVGIPIVEIADACIARGIRFIAFRNEQSASYAAQAYGYLTGRPGVCLVVGGPGVVHAMAGIVNATVNCWPILVIAGYIETWQKETGGFQELDHISLLKPHTKFAAQPPSIDRIPFILEKAYRTAFYGRPGPAFVDIPADFIRGSVSHSIPKINRVPDSPKSMASMEMISKTISRIKNANAPLIVIGKGCAYARAESQIRNLVDSTQIPFLPTPMGKGVVPDSHLLNVAAARSTALANADVVLLFGARLNWILHFGKRPKWREDVTFIQIDIAAEELGNNNVSEIRLLGDVGLVAEQLQSALSGWTYPSSSSRFVKAIREKSEKNLQAAHELAASHRLPMSYQCAFSVIKEALSATDVFYVSEGANTMDISRSIFDVQHPRQRIDAGTFATMGVGMGYAIAGTFIDDQSDLAQIANPNRRVVGIVGDSAFGFSAMEIETAVRSNLPLLIFVINNNGIYFGLDSKTYKQTHPLPSTALSPDTRYDMIADVRPF